MFLERKETSKPMEAVSKTTFISLFSFRQKTVTCFQIIAVTHIKKAPYAHALVSWSESDLL